jgi:hypothetical protein
VFTRSASIPSTRDGAFAARYTECRYVPSWKDWTCEDVRQRAERESGTTYRAKRRVLRLAGVVVQRVLVVLETVAVAREDDDTSNAVVHGSGLHDEEC